MKEGLITFDLLSLHARKPKYSSILALGLIVSAAGYTSDLIPKTGCKIELSEGSRDDEPAQVLAEERRLLTALHIKSNADFAQMNEGITLALMQPLMSGQSSASSFRQTPSEVEIQKVGDAMDKLHKKCGIRYRMRGHVDLQQDGFKEVSPDRIGTLIEAANQQALARSINLARELHKARAGTDAESAWLRGAALKIAPKGIERLKYFDDYFSSGDPIVMQVADDLRRIGQVLTELQKSPELRAIAADHLKNLRTFPDDRNQLLTANRGIARRIEALVRDKTAILALPEGFKHEDLINFLVGRRFAYLSSPVLGN